MSLTDGPHRAKPVEIADEEGNRCFTRIGSSGGGTPCYEVLFKISSGPHAGEEHWWSGWLTPKTVERVAKTMRILGATSDDPREVVKQKLDQEVELVFKEEEFKGKVTTKIAYVNPAGPVAMDKLAEMVLKALEPKPKDKKKSGYPNEPEDDLPW